MERAHAANPRSFHIPDLDERRGLAVGSHVRLHLMLAEEGPDLPRAERMWVDIVERAGDPPRYVGVLTSQPVCIRDLDAGARIGFGPEHVAQVLIRRTNPRWFEAAEKKAMVSEKVFEHGGDPVDVPRCWMWIPRSFQPSAPTSVRPSSGGRGMSPDAG